MTKCCEPWQIAAARFCVEQKDNEFTQDQLIKALRNMGYGVHEWHIKRFFYEEVRHPAGTQYDREPRGENEIAHWTAPLQLVSTIIDYDELKEARKNALNAWWMAIFALIVSAIAAIFQGLQYFASIQN